MALPWKPAPPNPELDALLKAAREKAAALPPHDHLSMLAVQNLSQTLGEYVAAVEDTGPKQRLARLDAAERMLDRYDRAISGDYSRELGVMAAGYLALLTDKDRAFLCQSIAEKRARLAAVAVPA